MENKTTVQMVSVAIMAAITCIMGPLTIPIGPIPVSLCIFGIYLAVYILGMKKGTLSVLLYLLIGLIGIPVFSGFSAGAGKLFGPTGGYLIGYIFLALISGYFIDKFSGKPALQFAGMVLGLAVLYLFGTVWLAYQANMTAQAAFAAGVAPFILIDLVKIAVTLGLGSVIKKRLIAASLI